MPLDVKPKIKQNVGGDVIPKYKRTSNSTLNSATGIFTCQGFFFKHNAALEGLQQIKAFIDIHKHNSTQHGKHLNRLWFQ